jgi:hypothetical protein
MRTQDFMFKMKDFNTTRAGHESHLARAGTTVQKLLHFQGHVQKQTEPPVTRLSLQGVGAQRTAGKSRPAPRPWKVFRALQIMSEMASMVISTCCP